MHTDAPELESQMPHGDLVAQIMHRRASPGTGVNRPGEFARFTNSLAMDSACAPENSTVDVPSGVRISATYDVGSVDGTEESVSSIFGVRLHA